MALLRHPALTRLACAPMAIKAALLAAAIIVSRAPAAGAPTPRSVVVDQTGSAVPGATVQLLNGTVVVSATVTDATGTFAFEPALAGDTVTVSMSGFETARVARADAGRVTLAIARTSES